MTTVERFNLQTGREEGLLNSYTIESPLDNYIIQTHKIMARIKEQQQQSDFEEYIKQLIDDQLDDCLEKALSDVFKNFF